MTASASARLPLEELARLPSFYSPQVSWDERRLAYFADRSGRMELYVMDLPGGASRQLSHGEVPRTPYGGFTWNRAGVLPSTCSIRNPKAGVNPLSPNGAI